MPKGGKAANSSVSTTPEPVSTRAVKISYWYITHKFTLRKWGIGFLIAVCALEFGYTAWRSYRLFFVEADDYRRLVASLQTNYVNYPGFRELNRAQDLQLVSFETYGGKEGKFDYALKLFNPNSRYVAQQVEIDFVDGGQVLAHKTAFVYPQEEKYVAVFGIAGSANPQVQISQVKWRRFIGFAAYAEERLRFAVTNAVFTPASDLHQIGGESPVSRASFEVKNDTAYSYWSVGFYVVLLGGTAPVGISYVSLDQFKAGETRSAEVRWYEPLPEVSEVQVVPEVNILDSAVYMSVQ